MSVVYGLESGNRTYVGVAVNLHRRLRQHNGELVGGARATRGRSWRVQFVVSGLARTHALQLEWRLHRRRPRHEPRWQQLCRALQLERVTKTASLTATRMIEVGWATPDLLLLATHATRDLPHILHTRFIPM